MTREKGQFLHYVHVPMAPLGLGGHRSWNLTGNRLFKPSPSNFLLFNSHSNHLEI
jgi:hypothetical protein